MTGFQIALERVFLKEGRKEGRKERKREKGGKEGKKGKTSSLL